MEETGQGTDLIALTTTSSLSGGIFLFFFLVTLLCGEGDPLSGGIITRGDQ